MSSSLKLDWCSYEAARYAVETWHYSRRMPRSKLVKVGCWEDGKFIGCVLFGCGANNRLGDPFGLKGTEVAELVRVALTKHQTPTSKIVSIATRMLRKLCPGLKLLVAYSDPDQNHLGILYQALGFTYTGRSQDHKYPVLDGQPRHPRTLSLRVKAGRTTRDAVKRYVLKPGKHRYLYPLNDEMRKQIEPLRQPYPKKKETICGCSLTGKTPNVLLGDTGSRPSHPLHLVRNETYSEAV